MISFAQYYWNVVPWYAKDLFLWNAWACGYSYLNWNNPYPITDLEKLWIKD